MVVWVEEVTARLLVVVSMGREGARGMQWGVLPWGLSDAPSVARDGDTGMCMVATPCKRWAGLRDSKGHLVTPNGSHPVACRRSEQQIALAWQQRVQGRMDWVGRALAW